MEEIVLGPQDQIKVMFCPLPNFTTEEDRVANLVKLTEDAYILKEGVRVVFLDKSPTQEIVEEALFGLNKDSLAP